MLGELRRERSQHCTRIADDADFHRPPLTDDERIDIDLHDALRKAGALIPVRYHIEAGADDQRQIGSLQQVIVQI